MTTRACSSPVDGQLPRVRWIALLTKARIDDEGRVHLISQNPSAPGAQIGSASKFSGSLHGEIAWPRSACMSCRSRFWSIMSIAILARA